MSRILIVDDDLDVGRSFARILSQSGYEVVAVFDAESALKAVATDRGFSGMFIDLHMPDVDGLTLLRRLRQVPEGQRTPVAVVTGYWLLDDQAEAELRQLGAIVRFKPLWDDDLVELARTLVDSTSHL